MKKHLFSVLFCLFALSLAARQTWIVSPAGRDDNEGTLKRPLRSIEAALAKAAAAEDAEVEILFRAGTYYLPATVRIEAVDFAGKKLSLASYPGETAVFSGGKRLFPDWKATEAGYWKASVDESSIDQLYIDGKKRVLARYPNYSEGECLNGTAADALSARKVASWKNPQGGFIHALHQGRWGSMHYAITGKQDTLLTYEGGEQMNRPSPMHPQYRFVENIFEELDAPGEWFFDKKEKVLYYYPLPGEDMRKTVVETAALAHILELSGTPDCLLKNVTVRGIRFEHALRTVMFPYERLMRSDWSIYRGAALVLENTEDCVVSGCEFTNLGGNALFVSRYNRNARIEHNHIHHIGASAVCLVGDTGVVRLELVDYGGRVSYDEVDRVPGPRSGAYPRQCVVEDNLIHHIGEVEKQVAGVQIQLAAQIQVSHNTIYRVPRAAINVGDGAFGGHLIEYNDAFETVLETGDHGAFNSWGRDRFWAPDYGQMARQTAEEPEIILLDALYTTVLRNNRFRCDHGWDIDLDDGSSNYHIYNNICLNGGIKLREGFFRKVENNVVINNSLHPHVWFEKSGDVVRRNVFMKAYAPIAVNGWGEYIDYNCFLTEEALRTARENRTDVHSVFGPLDFADAENGNYTLPTDCAAFRIGFENVPTDGFGVYTPELKKMAEQPEFPELQTGN